MIFYLNNLTIFFKFFKITKKGYENSKRYLSVNLDIFSVSDYWLFIYENKINNIILMEDLSDEDMVIFFKYFGKNFYFKNIYILS